MNKKEFIRNRPFDEQDALEMQGFIEDAIRDVVKSITQHGIVEGLDVSVSGLDVTISPGKAFDSNYNLINIKEPHTLRLNRGSEFDRYDLISIRYRKEVTLNQDVGNKYGHGTSFVYSKNQLDSFSVFVTRGEPSENPEKPMVPEGNVGLALIYIPANSSNITQDNITIIKKDIKNVYFVGEEPPENKRLLWIKKG